MNDTEFNFMRPGLLVSVRNAAEARNALLAGADVIDVKEPNRGPLGAADGSEIEAVVRTVESRVPVTAAMGELVEFLDNGNPSRRDSCVPAGVSLVKFGLAGCRHFSDWQARWAETVAHLKIGSTAEPARPVAVAYADWQAADAPRPHDVLNAGIELGCPALLIDTWNKSGGGLFEHWPANSLHEFVLCVRRHRMLVVLAGSLSADDIRQAADLQPDLVAVRGAACENGRSGEVSLARVQALKRLLAACRFSHVPRLHESTTRQS